MNGSKGIFVGDAMKFMNKYVTLQVATLYALLRYVRHVMKFYVVYIRRTVTSTENLFTLIDQMSYVPWPTSHVNS